MADQEKISWQAPEYTQRNRSRDWYVVLAIIALGATVAAILIGNILFALLIVIAGGTLAVTSMKTPRDVRFEINRRGILVDDRLYPYNTLEAFGIDEDPLPKLLARSKKTFMPILSLPLTEDLIEPVRVFLKERLPEEGLREPVIQKIIEHFGL